MSAPAPPIPARGHTGGAAFPGGRKAGPVSRGWAAAAGTAASSSARHKPHKRGGAARRQQKGR